MTLWDMCSFHQGKALVVNGRLESLGSQTLRQVVTFLKVKFCVDTYIIDLATKKLNKNYSIQYKITAGEMHLSN